MRCVSDCFHSDRHLFPSDTHADDTAKLYTHPGLDNTYEDGWWLLMHSDEMVRVEEFMVWRDGSADLDSFEAIEFMARVYARADLRFAYSIVLPSAIMIRKPLLRAAHVLHSHSRYALPSDDRCVSVLFAITDVHLNLQRAACPAVTGYLFVTRPPFHHGGASSCLLGIPLALHRCLRW